MKLNLHLIVAIGCLVSPLASIAPVVIARRNTVTNPITGAPQFYRLKQ